MNRVALCVATSRGVSVVRHLLARNPSLAYFICTFPETPGEPPFVGALDKEARAIGSGFDVVRRVERSIPLSHFDPQLCLFVNWRYLVPRAFFDSIPNGAFVFHDSLLPLYRGFSPTVWAIAEGAEMAGASLFLMSEQVDEGPIVDQAAISIGPRESVRQVFDKVTGAYLGILDRSFESLLRGHPRLQEQDHARATYRPRREDSDNKIDWRLDTSTIFNLIRAVTRPYQGAWTELAGDRFRIWWGEPLATPVMPAPGTFVRNHWGLTVSTGSGSLLVTDYSVEPASSDADVSLPTQGRFIAD
jgi:methionyl-tRNA formyltransferase